MLRVKTGDGRSSCFWKKGHELPWLIQFFYQLLLSPISPTAAAAADLWHSVRAMKGNEGHTTKCHLMAWKGGLGWGVGVHCKGLLQVGSRTCRLCQPFHAWKDGGVQIIEGNESPNAPSLHHQLADHQCLEQTRCPKETAVWLCVCVYI